MNRENKKDIKTLADVIESHIQTANVVMDHDIEIQKLRKKIAKLEKQEWGFYGK